MSGKQATEGIPAQAPYHGHAGIQMCGDWCRHFEPLEQDRWPGFGRCVHPLSLRCGQVFSIGHECTVGESAMDLPPVSA